MEKNSRNFIFFTITAIAGLFFLEGTLQADRTKVPITGYVVSASDGVPLEGDKTVNCKFFDAATGGTELAASGDTGTTVTFSEGIFTLLMTPPAGDTLFLECTVDGNVLGRAEIGATLFANSANALDDAILGSDFSTGANGVVSLASSIARSSSANTFSGTQTFSGNISIGTNSLVTSTATLSAAELSLLDGKTALMESGVTGVTATSPVASSGGTAPVISLTDDAINFAQISDTPSLDVATTISLGASNLVINTDAAGDFVIADAGTGIHVFSDSGLVGIGTITPSVPLDVKAPSTGANDGILVEAAAGTTGITDGIQIGSAATDPITNGINIVRAATAAIKLQNGETIDNNTDGEISFGGAILRNTFMKFTDGTNMKAKTSSYTVAAAETGTVFHTQGSVPVQESIFTLPPAAAGLVYTFVVAHDNSTNTPELNVKPDAASNGIILCCSGGAAAIGDKIKNPVGIGDSITVLAVDSTRWIVINQSGGVWVDNN